MPRNLVIALFAFVAGCLAACSSGATPTPIPQATQNPAPTQATPPTTQTASNPTAAGTGTNSAVDVYIDNPNDQMTDDEVNRVSEALISALKAKL